MDAVCLNGNEERAIARAAGVLRGGGVVAFPTETFYGLAVLPDHSTALARLVSLKGRDADKPIPLIAASRPACEAVADIPSALLPLCSAFWPGPLTLAVLPRVPCPAPLVGHHETLGIRVSSHSVATDLARAAGGLITSTSANPPGGEPPRKPSELAASIAAGCDLLLDGGELPGGLPSTVVGAHGDDVILLRPGAVSAARLEAVLGRRPLPR